MIKKILTKTKEVLIKGKESIKVVAFALAISYMNMPITAMANNQSYLKPINNLKTIAISIVAAAGVIVLIYGGVKFATSFQKMDQNGEHQAVYTIIAGGIMIGISAIVAALTA